MGEIKVGDYVFDELGQPTRVSYTSEIELGDSYRVEFSDGSNIVADAEHLWMTWDSAARLRESSVRTGVLTGTGRGDRPQCMQGSTTTPQVRTTAEIRRTLKHGNESNHSIRNALPLDLPERILPVPAYTLGRGLVMALEIMGRSRLSIQRFWDEIRKDGFEVREQPSQRRGSVSQYTILGLRPQLREAGVLQEKFIPDDYLRASFSQRLALLQGIADTDGCRNGKTIEISCSDKRLADGIYELVVSLGMKATNRWRETTHRPSCRIRFSPVVACFRLPRKHLNPSIDVRRTRRYITSIESVDDVQMRCIAVESSSHLFLAGKAMTPTHNTYTANVMAEEMVKVGIPWVALDPTGAWWGLRAGKDGGSKGGLPVYVFGGQHGDLSLEETAGKVIADLIVDQPGHYILDVSEFPSKASQRRFATDFGDRLFRRKAKNRDVLHVFIDEADVFVPQKIPKGHEKMVGIYEEIVRRGGIRGLGTTLISQRSAIVNKNVLEQLDALIILRIVGPRDQKAILEYVQAEGDEEEVAELKSTIKRLKLGEAWFWEPGAEPPIFERVQIRERRTFNSSATPDSRERIGVVKMAKVDLDLLRGQIESTIEQAAAEDPRLLQKKIREKDKRITALEFEVSKLTEDLAEAEQTQKTEEVEVPVLEPEVVDSMMEALGPLAAVLEEVSEKLTENRPNPFMKTKPPLKTEHKRSVASRRTKPTARKPEPAGDLPPIDDFQWDKATKAIMGVLFQFDGSREKKQLAVLAGYSSKGGGFNNALGKLRSAGLIEGSGIITTSSLADGLDFEVEPLPRGDELFDYWMTKLGKAEREILTVLFQSGGQPMSKFEIAEATESGYKPTGGGFNNALGALRTRDLIEGRGDSIRAADMLFE